MKMKMILVFVMLLIIINKIDAQITGGTALLTLNTLENKAQSMVSSIEGSANNVINNASLNILNAIREFKDAYGSMLKDTERVLDKEVEKIFVELRSSINMTFDHLNNSLDKVDNSINSLGLVVSKIPFTDKTPRVTNFKIPTAINGQSKSAIVSFRGILLNDSDNRLYVNGKPLVKRQMTDNYIDFEIPASYFNVNSNCENSIPLKLYLYKGRKPKIHNFVLKVHSKQIAEVEVIYEVVKEEIRRYPREYKESEDVGSPGASSGRKKDTKSFTISPTPGRTIDVNSVSVDKDVRSGRGDCKDDFQITPSGIRVKIKVESDSHIGGRGGKVNCTYKFTELETVRTTERKSVKQILYSTSSMTVELPANTNAIKFINIKYCDGTSRSISSIYNASYPLFILNYSTTTKVLILTPKLN